MLAKVPGGISALDFPATVTVAYSGETDQSIRRKLIGHSGAK
jgi:hypothetical protein